MKSTALMPVTDRIEVLDIIRGFAVFGIFLVNVPDMTGRGAAFVSEHIGADALVRFLYDAFVQMKFYTIFSFLFGLGFYIFMSRAESAGRRSNGLFIRRLLILLAIGAVHILLLWFGDILNTYAMIGFLLLLFYRRQTNTLMIWSLCLLGLYSLLVLLASASSFLLGISVPPMFDNVPSWQERAQFLLLDAFPNALTASFEILPLFLLGLYAGKKGWFQNLHEHADGFKKWQRLSFIVSIIFIVPMVIYYFLRDTYNSNDVMFFTYVTSKSLAIFYICTIARMAVRFGTKPFSGLAAVGRLALSNYLTQSIITIFLITFVWTNAASFPLWTGTVYCIVVFAVQIVVSRLWVRFFRIGPIEWLWRAGTYGVLPPFRKQQSRGEASAASSMK